MPSVHLYFSPDSEQCFYQTIYYQQSTFGLNTEHPVENLSPLSPLALEHIYYHQFSRQIQHDERLPEWVRNSPPRISSLHFQCQPALLLAALAYRN
jgi:hypothetical protein